MTDRTLFLCLSRGRTIVFGNFSGLSLRGEIVLYVGEVASNWKHKIKAIPKEQHVLDHIPRVEKALSISLNDVKVKTW